MNLFTQMVIIIGRITPQGVSMLGTGFIINNDGLIATTAHNISGEEKNLVILAPNIREINEYQDLTDLTCKPFSVNILEIDPIKDIALLHASIQFVGQIPEIGSLDDEIVGQNVDIYGFPHCVEGRRVLTYQRAEIGAKILLSSSGMKIKHCVINIQSRPGQSGSLIISPRSRKICAILMGAYAPSRNSGISIIGIDPRELHQTTHCVSAEYIKEMI